MLVHSEFHFRPEMLWGIREPASAVYLEAITNCLIPKASRKLLLDDWLSLHPKRQSCYLCSYFEINVRLFVPFISTSVNLSVGESMCLEQWTERIKLLSLPHINFKIILVISTVSRSVFLWGQLRNRRSQKGGNSPCLGGVPRGWNGSDIIFK